GCQGAFHRFPLELAKDVDAGKARRDYRGCRIVTASRRLPIQPARSRHSILKPEERIGANRSAQATWTGQASGRLAEGRALESLESLSGSPNKIVLGSETPRLLSASAEF